MKAKDIGIKVPLPKTECHDNHCPFHGSIKPRGRMFTGKVVKSSMHKTVTVEWMRLFYLPKYERYEKRKTRIKAHKPDCIKAEIGDTVRIMESRPISKTKNFVVIEVLKHEGS